MPNMTAVGQTVGLYTSVSMDIHWKKMGSLRPAFQGHSRISEITDGSGT